MQHLPIQHLSMQHLSMQHLSMKDLSISKIAISPEVLSILAVILDQIIKFETRYRASVEKCLMPNHNLTMPAYTEHGTAQPQLVLDLFSKEQPEISKTREVDL